MKDCKNGEMKVQARSSRPIGYFISVLILTIVSILIIWNLNTVDPYVVQTNDNNVLPPEKISSPTHNYNVLEGTVTNTDNPIALNEIEYESETVAILDTAITEAELINDFESQNVSESVSNQEEHVVKVKSGDSLALIFSRLHLSPTTLYKIMSIGQDVSKLKHLRPGQQLKFIKEDNLLTSLEYELNLTDTLKITRLGDKYESELITEELESVVKNSRAIIKDSLFLSGKRAGLSDNLIMQLVAIYGWDIDFALDIREGDSFTVIYEEQYKDGMKVSDGPIIAAEFINRNTALRAIRYTHADGRTDYYADNGDAMRKAFLRTPVNFTRISSRFNLKRKHPVLNRIRAHKGVDYAAPTGTPVKATGDGIVTLAGRKGGYGRTVILRHGGKYSTLYAHLHRYAKGVRNGKRVKQGQVIGYVGKSGLATGPHLHYEFRLNGVHRNPLTIKLPKVESIKQDALPEFQKTITPMLAELDRITGKNVLASQQTDNSTNLKSQSMEDG